MSLSDSESGIAFEVALEDSPTEAFTKPPDLPHHLKLRMQAYVSSRPKKNIDAKLREAEKRRKRQIDRRAENARRAEERCRRIAEAMSIVTDYNRHLKGSEVEGLPPKASEVREVYKNIKEDLNVIIGRVDREAVRLLDRKYVHNPQSYQPRRRNTHTAKCTCECCYLENKEKLAYVQKDLMEVLSRPAIPQVPDDDNKHDQIQMDSQNSPESTYEIISSRRMVRFTEPVLNNKSAELGFSSHSILDIPKSSLPTACRSGSGLLSKGVHASLAVGPDCSMQTDAICCPSCDAFQDLKHLTRAVQTKVASFDVACQTEADLFTCHCCRIKL